MFSYIAKYKKAVPKQTSKKWSNIVKKSGPEFLYNDVKEWDIQNIIKVIAGSIQLGHI